MSNKDLQGNKGFQGKNLYGIKDNILNAFAERDFAQVMRLADLLDMQESSASDFGKSFNKDSSGNCGGDCSEDFGCDCSEDFISEGAKELGEFTSSAIALSALEVAKSTQARDKITKQAVIFAKIALKAHKDLQDKISQDKSTQNEQNKSTQDNLCDEISQDKMAFYDLTLARAYASNGDIAKSKEILQNLAKPFLDFALQGAKSSAKSSAMDSSAVNFNERGLDSHIDENIAGGGGR